MVTDSFYGGVPGQDFTIRKKFANRVALEADLTNRWNSEVGAGQFVVVSYDIPGSEGYDKNLEIDQKAFEGYSFNSTLWQKVYDSADNTRVTDLELEDRLWRTPSNFGSGSSGFYYILLASMSGNTPQFSITKSYVEADQQLDIDQNLNQGLDKPVLHFTIPKTWQFNVTSSSVAATSNASLSVSESGNPKDTKNLVFSLPKAWNLKLDRMLVDADTSPSVVKEAGENSGSPVDTKTFTLNLPRAWNFTHTLTVVKPGANPELTSSITRGTGTNPDTKVLAFKLPKAWQFEIGSVTNPAPTATPQITLTNKTGDEVKLLNFVLPKSQVIELGTIDRPAPTASPNVTLTNKTSATDENVKILSFTLPKSQVIELGNVSYSAPGVDPVVTLNNKNAAADENTKLLGFVLPKSQVIELGTVNYSAPGVSPQITLTNKTSFANENTKLLNFTLPKSMTTQLGDVIVVDADKEPEIEERKIQDNILALDFKLPQSQVMLAPTTKIVAPSTFPIVTFGPDNTVNTPQLQFSLPRGIKIYSGELLGDKSATTFTYSAASGVQAPQNGDLYINPKAGLIFTVTGNNNNVCSAEFLSEMYRPLPSVEMEQVKPYADGTEGDTVVLNTPTIVITDKGNNQWTAKIGLPSAPKINLNTEFVGPAVEGEAERKYQADNESIDFNFKIPRGSRIVVGKTSDYLTSDAAEIEAEIAYVDNGTDTPYYFYYNGKVGFYAEDREELVGKLSNGSHSYSGVIPDTKIGDFFFDNYEGRVYECIDEEQGKWTLKDGTFKGNDMQIITKYSYVEGLAKLPNGELAANIDADRQQLIRTSLVADNIAYPPTANEIVAVDWTDSIGVTTSYWYCYSVHSGWVYSVISSTNTYSKDEIDRKLAALEQLIEG